MTSMRWRRRRRGRRTGGSTSRRRKRRSEGRGKERCISRRRQWGVSAPPGRSSGPQTTLSIIRSRWARLKGALFIMLHHSIARAPLLLKASPPSPVGPTPRLSLSPSPSSPSSDVIRVLLVFLQQRSSSSKMFMFPCFSDRSVAPHMCCLSSIYSRSCVCCLLLLCVLSKPFHQGVLASSVATDPTRPVTPLLQVFLLQVVVPQCFYSGADTRPPFLRH